MGAKKNMIVMFAAFLLMLWIPKEVSAAGAVKGYCGKGSLYYYDTDTKVLTISGDGKVTNNPWKSYKDDIKKVIVNEGITSIDGFANHTALTSVQLPKSLTQIEALAFHGCTALKSITIPKNVKKIGGQAFHDCTALTAVSLPKSKSLISLGNYAFANCTALKSITIPKNVDNERDCFAGSGVTTVIFEEGTTEVGSYLFLNCENLTTIHFPQTMKKIGDGAFMGCTGLTTVTLPWYLQEIGNRSFAYCSNLKKITIYQKVKEIEDDAFANITDLTIYCKKGTKAHSFAKSKRYFFASCKIPALKGITYKKGNLKYTVVTDYINGKGTVCVTGMGKKASSVTIPNTVKLESYNYKVTKINKKAFYKKSALKKVTIKATGIKKIGSNAFGEINQRAIIYVPKSKYKQYNKMLKKAGVKSPMKIKKR